MKAANPILFKLKKNYPDSTCSLRFSSPFELLVATVLSAQCTDARVNAVTPTLFKHFPTPQKMSDASLKELETIIRSTGFYRAKAKSLQALSQALVAHHGSKVPGTMQALTSLRGVGRKTANVVLGHAFSNPQGIVVDTHVKRLSYRLGLTQEKDPVKVEQDLVQIIPKKDWILFSHLLIDHGRSICVARKPRCRSCFLNSDCPKAGVLL